MAGIREKSIRPFIAALLGIVSVSFLALSQASPAAASIEFVTEWGAGTTGSQFRQPLDVAADASGDVYVIDNYASQVKKFTKEGTFIRSWGSFGDGPGEFDLPTSIAVHRSSGTVYVADTRNSRIQRFTADGQFIGQWEATSSESPSYPNGVAVDQASGTVYAVSGFSRDVSRYSPTGTLLGRWGSSGTGDGQFELPRSIAVSGSGDVYVTDAGTKSVQRFDSDGTFLARFGSSGEGPGQFQSPAGITAAPDGRVFVLDSGLKRVSIFTAAGEYQDDWGDFGGQVSPVGIASLPSGELVITEVGYPPGVTRFQPDGTAINRWGSGPDGDGQFFEPMGLTASPAGGVYASDYGNRRIQEFTAGGTFIRKWDRAGRGGIDPKGLTADRSGNIHVADFGSSRVVVYSPSGTFLRAWGNYGTEPGQLFFPADLAIDRAGNYYIVDRLDRVQKFTSSGQFIESWGSRGSADGEFILPEGIALDSSGDVYVADTENGRVQKFTSSGEFLYSLGTGEGEQDLTRVSDVAVSLDDTLYALSLDDGRVVKFNPDGTFISSWGSRGAGEGQFLFPYAVATAPSTTGTEVFVVDYQDGRLQRFLDTDGPKSTASLSRLTVGGPAKARTGRPVTFTVGLVNSGALKASGVKLEGSGRGVSVSSPVGSVLPGVKRQVKVRVRFPRKGRVTLRFRATSANAGTVQATKTVTVR